MSNRLPFLPFYVSDYLSAIDVRLMGLAERGAYTHLLFIMWMEGRLPNDTSQLAVLCGCPQEEFEAVWPKVRLKFKVDGDGLIYNERLEVVRDEALRLHRSRVKGGRKGGLSRAKAKLKPGSSPTQASRSRSRTTTRSRTKPNTNHKNDPSPAPSPEDAVLMLLTSSYEVEYPVTKEKRAEYQKTYPGIDVDQELRSIQQWCVDNPSRRKTTRGMPRFLNAWMDRAQNRPRPKQDRKKTFEELLARNEADSEKSRKEGKP